MKGSCFQLSRHIRSRKLRHPSPHPKLCFAFELATDLICSCRAYISLEICVHSHMIFYNTTIYWKWDILSINQPITILWSTYYESYNFARFLHLSLITVTTSNSCTKCMGSLGIIHDRKPKCHPVSCAWIHGWTHINARSLDSLYYVCHWRAWLIFWVFVQPGTSRRPVYWCRNFMSVLYVRCTRTHPRVLWIGKELGTAVADSVCYRRGCKDIQDTAESLRFII